jgi:transketolase
MADLAVVLWTQFLRIDPTAPEWPDRDRFVLSNGHGSMLLYAALHLSGFPMTMDDLRSFRQLDSPTPGHPEIDQELGIEMTTGPLGQGFATGVGLAVAESHLRAQLGEDLVSHRTYGFVSDGDLMEGVAAEAASLAGHLELGRLIYIFDDNGISLVGPTSWTFTEDVPKRFEAYGWQTLAVDGHDQAASAETIQTAVADETRPSLISAKTHIGYGSPTKQDTAAAHGSPLGPDEIQLVRDGLGWDLPPFEVPAEVYDFYASGMKRGIAARQAWESRVAQVADSDPDRFQIYQSYFDPESVTLTTPGYEPGTSVATRVVSGRVIQDAAGRLPGLVGGSADLASSTNTLIAGSADFAPGNRTGRNIRFGVREHAMGALVNGLTLHGGLRGYGATFLTFSDYMRGAVRLGALMGAPSIWVWTHDSIFLGEDGPTHQPVEHLAALRAIPNLWVVRPATPGEVAGAWQLALDRVEGPTALIFSRQGVPVPNDDVDPASVARGGFVVRDGTDLVLVATGSEVNVAIGAAERLATTGRSVRVVSMPCVEAFFAQSLDYRREVLGPGLPVVSLEAGATFGWGSIVGADGLSIGIDTYGASAPASVLAAHLGLTPDAVGNRIVTWLEGR